MKSCVLASGSKGNITYIETKHHKILIDLGMTSKYLNIKLAEIDIKPEQIDTIIITHSHKDHTSALKTFIKKYNPKIYITFPMLIDIEELKEYKNTVVYEEEIELNEVKIKSIKLSHDTNDIRGFIIESNNKSLVYITDTGYINQKYLNDISNKDMYLMESNHDIEMLINGRYPEHLKRRVYGPKGHLSNIDASLYLSKIIGKKTKNIILMHLSENNNSEEKAYETIKETLKEDAKKINIKCARQQEISGVIEL